LAGSARCADPDTAAPRPYQFLRNRIVLFQLLDSVQEEVWFKLL
jgi:hypothetical protein